MFETTEVIYSYTRAQAIEDGVLIDVTHTAEEAGFRVPVALTTAVWMDCVDWPIDDRSQDMEGRLWDVLYLAAFEARRKRNSRRVVFQLLRVIRGCNQLFPVQLVLHIGGGDHGEPVITIMQPNED
ncbi:hypothetical protein CKO12_13565 [Chromatium okenii]|uniref:DUF6573 family protein n=1 Tax=Chromatium okenii TaxID=61644 RepID=UPI001904E32E|nr:DUF6573 family protein [Chromatium okenii]MBK1642878.1 hypothetical protein [Chromatium okenii]